MIAVFKIHEYCSVNIFMSIFLVLYEINLLNLYYETRINQKMATAVEIRRSVKPQFRSCRGNLKI